MVPDNYIAPNKTRKDWSHGYEPCGLRLDPVNLTLKPQTSRLAKMTSREVYSGRDPHRYASGVLRIQYFYTPKKKPLQEMKRPQVWAVLNLSRTTSFPKNGGEYESKGLPIQEP